MKFHNLLASLLALGIATGAGSAFAQDITSCDGFKIAGENRGGFIDDLEVDSITLNGESCYIAYVNVSGDVTVRNADLFILQDSSVGGDLKVVNNRTVASIASSQFEGEILVRNNDDVNISVNTAREIRVIGNGNAEVNGNVALRIDCRNNDITKGFTNVSYSGNNCE